MLRGIAWRLGFILCLAVTARVIGGFFSPAHPLPKRAMPDITASRPDDPLPTSPEMRGAIERVKRADRPGWSDGPQLTYGRGPESVTVTPRQLAAARAMVRYEREAIARQMARVEKEERDGTVSFEPGEPMIDPNPGDH
jgi:hypothetical protein